MSSLIEVVWKSVRDNGRPTELIEEALRIEQHGTAQGLVYFGYIPITCSRELVKAGMCTRPS